MGADETDVKSLFATQGCAFTVNLWEDRTRGEQWVPSYDSSVFAMIGDDFFRTTSNNAVDSGQRQFKFEPLQVGIHRLEFHKRMAWKFTAEARRIFAVEVKATQG